MIGSLLLIARLVLAGVFAVASFAKLSDRPGTRDAVVAFGAPARVAGQLALLIALAELSVAGLLLPAATATAGAAGALVLLLVFSAAIAVSIARGRAPDCHCFGRLHSAPADGRALARNGGLLVVAALVLVGSLAGHTPSSVSWIGHLHGLEAAAVAAGTAIVGLLVVGAMAFVRLLRSYGKALVRIDRLERRLAEAGLDADEAEPAPAIGIEPGVRAPAFAVPDTAGAVVSLDDLLAPGRPLLLLFTSPHCGPCKALLPDAAAWQWRWADRLTVAFACQGSLDQVRAEATENHLKRVLLDEHAELYEAFEASGTPSAVLVAADGTIASRIAPGRDLIEQLIGDAVAKPAESEGLTVGAGGTGARARLPRRTARRVV